ncbi:unnamed protein product [Hymenolepis diminuta]|uniref:Uncharacterized protein n=1 Tax=Hymenolepis diminuta TaxID=6216 RepID=A0A564Z6D5_HYMDI|nr:unnamed protein product [Hymenolepis diminuta]
MEWLLVDPKTLDFGNLTPVFWTIVFCGCLLIITLVGICCTSCCLYCRRRRQRRIQRRLSASSTLFPEDMEISSVLLRPPPVNPDYTPTPRPIRFPQSRHYQQYFQTEQSPTETLDDRIIRNPGPVPSSTTAEVSLPPTDSAPPCKYR